MDDWKIYERTGLIEARPYVPGEDLTEISVSAADYSNSKDNPEHSGSLKRLFLQPGMIARNPDNHNDQWYINEEYFNKNYKR